MKYNKNFCERYAIGTIEHNRVISPCLEVFLKHAKGRRIIDLGCGPGFYSRLFASHGAKVTGIDSSPYQIEIAREIEKKDKLGISYIKDDITRIKAKKKFDIAILAFVLINVSSKKKFIKIVKKSFELLKNRGILFIFEVHPHNVNRANTEDIVKLSGRNNYFSNESIARSVTWLENGEKIVFYPDYHYTLEFFLNTIIESGFTITNFIEPKYKAPYPTHMIIVAKKV